MVFHYVGKKFTPLNGTVESWMELTNLMFSASALLKAYLHSLRDAMACCCLCLEHNFLPALLIICSTFRFQLDFNSSRKPSFTPSLETEYA